MATWSDKRLAGHKRAQSYVSSTGATLGVAALGAVGAKAKPVQRLANRGAYRLLQRGADIKRVEQVRSAPGKIARASTPLTTASAGVGGVGGYNFAAIQSQEAKRARVAKANDFSPFNKQGRKNLKLLDRKKMSIKPEHPYRAAGGAAMGGAIGGLAGAYAGRYTRGFGAALTGTSIGAVVGAYPAHRRANEKAKALARRDKAFVPVAKAMSKKQKEKMHLAGAAGAGALGYGTATFGALSNDSVIFNDTHVTPRGNRFPVSAERSAAAIARASGKVVSRTAQRTYQPLKREYQRSRQPKGQLVPYRSPEASYSRGAYRGHEGRTGATRAQRLTGDAKAWGSALRSDVKAVRGFASKYPAGRAKLAAAGLMAAGGGLGAAGYLHGRKHDPKLRGRVKKSEFSPVYKRDWKNITEHQRRAADSRRVKRGGDALVGAGVGLAGYGAYKGGVGQAKTIVRAGKGIAGASTPAAAKLKAIGNVARRNPAGAMVLGGAGLAATGVGMQAGGLANASRHNRAIARQRKERAVKKSFEEYVEKAYSPERKRMKRLENAQTGAHVGGGALAGYGAARLGQVGRSAFNAVPTRTVQSSGRLGPQTTKVKDIGAIKIGSLKPFARPAGKAAGITALGAGAIVAGDRIKSYRKTTGKPYARPLRG